MAVVTGPEGAAELASLPAARDFVTDAFNHCKLIGHSTHTQPLLDAVGLGSLLDGGFVDLQERAAAGAFVQRCRELRYWDRPRSVSPAS